VDWIATTGKKPAVVSTLNAEGNDHLGFRDGWRRYLRSGTRKAADPAAVTSLRPATPKSRFTASRNRNGIENVCVSGGTPHRPERPSGTADIDIAYGSQNSTLSPK
jgi:hypothetical protein